MNKKLPFSKLLIYFIFSILLNSFANALTISVNLGSATWTASAVNLEKLTGISLGMILFLYGILVLITNSILLRKIEWHRLIGNFIFITPFSYLVQVNTSFLNRFNLISLPIIWRIILDVSGIFLISIAISIYQRANLVQHPNDDLAYILRFNYFKGNATKAQYISFMPPIIVMIICYIFMHKLYAVNIGTIVAILCQGSFIGWSDKHVFKKLQHQF